MNAKEFARYVARDNYCLHCGETEAIAPNHRVNRGMGGSKMRHTPSNIVVLCSRMNGLIEHASDAAATAKAYGWKLASWQNPLTEPVFDAVTGSWYLLDDSYNRREIVHRP